MDPYRYGDLFDGLLDPNPVTYEKIKHVHQVGRPIIIVKLQKSFSQLEDNVSISIFLACTSIVTDIPYRYYIVPLLPYSVKCTSVPVSVAEPPLFGAAPAPGRQGPGADSGSGSRQKKAAPGGSGSIH